MGYDQLIPLATPLVLHAGLSFFQSFRKGPSQYNDLLTCKVPPCKDNVEVKEFFSKELCEEHDCRELLNGVLLWGRVLRAIGTIPIILYFGILFLVLASGLIKEDAIDVNTIINILFGATIALQICYLVLKRMSPIPSILINLHPKYKTTSFGSVLLDIAPIWKKQNAGK